MTIDRLGPVDPVSKINNKNKPTNVEKHVPADSVAVSEEARRLAALQQTAEFVHAAPDVRVDRVEEVKEKLQDSNYINEKVVEAVADRLLDIFGV